ncbi:MAG TPA: type II secretion system protein GspG [Phycisphaerae bacterium]|nr:type II secretion system protein GspG [Phycisphaerae bacterium]
MSERRQVLSYAGKTAWRLSDGWLHVWWWGLVVSLVAPVVVAETWRSPWLTECSGIEMHRTRAESDASLLKSVLDEFEGDVGRYPLAREGLEPLLTRPADVPAEKWQGPYVKEVPEDPWGRAYRYVGPGSDGEVHVVSAGPDGVFGTADDVGE